MLGFHLVLELVRKLVAHGDAREGKCRGNWRMEWVASILTPPPNVVYPALLNLMRTLRLRASDWTDAPTNLNGLIRCGERRNLVSARVPSYSAQAIQQTPLYTYDSLKSVKSLQKCCEHYTNCSLGCFYFKTLNPIYYWKALFHVFLLHFQNLSGIYCIYTNVAS